MFGAILLFALFFSVSGKDSSLVGPGPPGAALDEKMTKFKMEFKLTCPVGPYEFKVEVVEHDVPGFHDFIGTYNSSTAKEADNRIGKGEISRELKGSYYGDLSPTYEFRTIVKHNCGGPWGEVEHMQECKVSEVIRAYVIEKTLPCKGKCNPAPAPPTPTPRNITRLTTSHSSRYHSSHY